MWEAPSLPTQLLILCVETGNSYRADFQQGYQNLSWQQLSLELVTKFYILTGELLNNKMFLKASQQNDFKHVFNLCILFNRNEYYGGYWATFNLDALLKWTENLKVTCLFYLQQWYQSVYEMNIYFI